VPQLRQRILSHRKAKPIADCTRLTPTQVITTLPPEFTGYSITAEIAVTRDGRCEHCSNRGHDSIAIFGANARTAH
jgi:6-phosphogluconolactonase